MKQRNAYTLLTVLFLLFIGCQKKHEILPEEQEIKKPEAISIIGGGSVNISEIPYQARIITANSGAAGIIIGDRWILTAAHVIGNNSPSAFTVYVGSNNINSGASYSVDAIYPHENFNSYTVGNSTIFDNDIALFHLSTSISFGTNVQPVRYYNNGVNLNVNQTGTASGWGQTTDHGLYGTNFSTVLKSVNINITNLSDSSKIIAGSASGPYTIDGICYGDSGGPFTVNDNELGKVLAGISSRADCSTGFSEFTNVAYYTDWIMEKTGIHYMAISGPSILCNSGTYQIENLPTNATIKWLNVPSSIQSDQSISYDTAYGNIVQAEISVGSRTITLQKPITIPPEVFTGVDISEISSNGLGGGTTLINHDYDYDDYANTIKFSFQYYPNLTLKYVIMGLPDPGLTLNVEIKNVMPNTDYALPTSLIPGVYNIGGVLVDDCGRECSDPFEAELIYAD